VATTELGEWPGAEPSRRGELGPGAGSALKVAVSLVLPTYNERENLAPLLERVTSALEDYEHEIIVVDDDSPDRTWEEAERLQRLYPRLRMIRRVGERGLSSAVVRGFREATGEILAVMDADLQHDEAILGKLIGALDEGDFAIASRSSAEESWGWQRQLKSQVATSLARLVLNVPISDPMSGYFAIRRSLFARLDDGTLRPEGFKIMLYLYARALARFGPENFQVREVAFVFRARLHGESKLTNRVIWEYLRMLVELRRRALLPRGFIRFGCVGALGVLVNNVALVLLHYRAGLHYLVAAAMAVELAIVHNYAFNELWTFSKFRRSVRSSWVTRLGKFQLVSLGGMVINLGILFVLRGLMDLPLLPSNLAGIAGAVVYNYAANKLWTWRIHI
jgi:dolichol-phosphate mannosyltransferase